jgi:hypothetical protein
MFDKQNENANLTPISDAESVPTVELETEPHKKKSLRRSFS